MSVSCECCVLSGRGLCDWLITRQRSPTECGVPKSVIVKPRKLRRPRPPRGCRAIEKKCQFCVDPGRFGTFTLIYDALEIRDH
jgi:hypothetical protein